MGTFYHRHVNRASHLPRWYWRLLAGIILLVVGWSPGANLLLIAATVISLLLTIRWRSALLLLPLLLNPMSLSFGSGLHEWFSAKPRFHYEGLPGYEFYNLDPDTRCYRETSGCMVRGDEWFTHAPYNAGLNFMVSLFGFPGHTYHGPYPSKNEAIQLTETNSITPPDLFLKGKVQANGKDIVIGQDVAQKIIGDFGIYVFEMDSGEIVRNVKAAIFRDHCLVIRVGAKEKAPAGSFENESEGVVLFDLDRMHPIARYVISGYAQRTPKLLKE